MELELKDKVALVTEEAVVLVLKQLKCLQRGCKVVVGYNNGAIRAVNLVEALFGSGHNCVQISLEDQNFIQRAETFVKNTYGKLDYLINSAGYTEPIKHTDLVSKPRKFNKIINANAGEI